MEVFTGLLGVILGSVITGVVQWQATGKELKETQKSNLRNERVKCTRELRIMFDSPEYRRIRQKADKIIHTAPKASFKELLPDPEPYQLAGFYEILWSCIKYEQVEESMAVDLFDSTFYNWYWNAFEPQLSISTDALDTHWKSIKELKNWFDLKIPERCGTLDEQGKDYRQKRLQEMVELRKQENIGNSM
jgi:hypothetical protein